MKNKVRNITKGIMFMMMLGISNVALAAGAPDSQYWQNRFESMLICNSRSGGAISEVRISEVQKTKSGKWKVSGSYKQENSIALTLPKIASNQFAGLTGIFQVFLVKEKIISAKFKISFLSGWVKTSCLNSNADDFDF